MVVLDTEHGCLDVASVEMMIRAAELAGITPLVRITGFEKKLVGRYLDIGAHGIQVPMVNTRELAEKVVDAAKYKPWGSRGVSSGRGARWGTIPDLYNTANREGFIVCMCETMEAVENINDICKTQHMDAVFVGTGDLSQTIGCTGKVLNNPAVEECVEKVLKACKDNGIIPAITSRNVEDTKNRIKQGFQYVTLANEMKLLQVLLNDVAKEINSLAKK
jgi:2-keto-3-deoxy-L-rhamnonate aldolase RhmA